MSVLAEMERHPEEPWKIRDHLLKKMRWYNASAEDGVSAWEKWSRRRNQRIFDRDRMSVEEINAICPGYSPSLTGTALEEWCDRYHAALEERRLAEQKTWEAEQDEMARAWADWMRWREKDPRSADEWQRLHQDETGDQTWLLDGKRSLMPRPQQRSECSVTEEITGRSKSIDPRTGIWPMSDWGSACGRGTPNDK
jgi:hypothetical protein